MKTIIPFQWTEEGLHIAELVLKYAKKVGIDTVLEDVKQEKEKLTKQ
ncbi:hypothetical protein ACFGY8_04215 [Pasteurella multocida]